jgi:hypothetical protein
VRGVPTRLGIAAQIAEHGAGFHRRQLILVTQQYQPRMGGKASSRLAIISRSIIEASSTTSTSSGNTVARVMAESAGYRGGYPAAGERWSRHWGFFAEACRPLAGI